MHELTVVFVTKAGLVRVVNTEQAIEEIIELVNRFNPSRFGMELDRENEAAIDFAALFHFIASSTNSSDMEFEIPKDFPADFEFEELPPDAEDVPVFQWFSKDCTQSTLVIVHE